MLFKKKLMFTPFFMERKKNEIIKIKSKLLLSITSVSCK